MTARALALPVLLVAALGLVLGLTYVGGTPDYVNGVPVRVCGTVRLQPLRLSDDVCRVHKATESSDHAVVVWGLGPVRWWRADPACLDPDDLTEVGEVLDDDYLGYPCGTDGRTRTRAATTTTRPPAASKAVLRPPVTASTARPARPQATTPPRVFQAVTTTRRAS